MKALIARTLSRLRADTGGSVFVEFALLGPALLVMMFGVLQVGIAFQSYSALRSLSADVARYAMVQYQTGNTLSNSQLRTFARNQALGAPYLMTSDRLAITVEDADDQRVTGAKEVEISVTYRIYNMMGFIGIEGPTVDYVRPIFLVEEAAA
ncbi:TadE/TadG family type IV pilus assembly protein [Aurantiacibacter luteus]|uniref:TadE-like domain-containing protein n=1 Tax=Aurantiacibacter luteus TaxID=1581420 RepID=A0A0G9MY14_9SPHN|nr:TadE/TadG family type IV pilus assembly protein [Aurantiacibacter luteus]KLE35484.1 hypothetical protein AAW00_03400 [Aurantiacibacter luteus]